MTTFKAAAKLWFVLLQHWLFGCVFLCIRLTPAEFDAVYQEAVALGDRELVAAILEAR